MTIMKNRSPTNKEFKTNFQRLASDKPKKGHLESQDKKASDNAIETGRLIRVERSKYYSNGWEVKVGKGSNAVTYMCSNLDQYVPPFRETKKYLVFKGNVEVEISIDKKSKIYQITRIKSSNKKAMTLYEDSLVISQNENEKNKKSNSSSIELGKETINLKSDTIKITDSNNNEIDLVSTINEIKETLNQMQKNN